MGRHLPWPWKRQSSGVDDDDSGATAAWQHRLVSNAQHQGRMPYVVEGFFEIHDAVRRGHPVVVERATCQVADGTTVFADDDSPSDQPTLVTITRFDPTRARFVITDPVSEVGTVELTPRRLQVYLSNDGRDTGVALGA